MKMEDKTNALRCLGIDPGLANTGWAVISRHRSGRFDSLASGVIRTASNACDAVRYASIYNAVNALIGEHTPDLLSIEKVYFNKNVSSCLSTASVIGVILLASELAGVASRQVHPQQVKAAVCGVGRASKAAVKPMVSKLLGVNISNAQVSCDAAATAIAGLLQKSSVCGRELGYDDLPTTQAM